MKQQHRNSFNVALVIALIIVGCVCGVVTWSTWSDGWHITEEGE